MVMEGNFAFVDNFYKPPEVIERRMGKEGELQLQRRGSDFEFIYNGIFLMATYNGAAEKEMARMSLRGFLMRRGFKKNLSFNRYSPFLKVLIGGLGFGLSLQEVLRCSLVESVSVVELEEAVVNWNRGVLSDVNGRALADPRVKIYLADLVDFLQNSCFFGRQYHAVILDTDNGPGWLSRSGNSFLYGEKGAAVLKKMLAPGGALAVWSASPAPSYCLLLQKYFKSVQGKQCLEKTGETSYYYLAWKVASGGI